MRTPYTALLIVLLFVVVLAGCKSTGDPISLLNAREAADTIDRYIDPTLPDSAKNAAKEQAEGWVEWEEQKFGGKDEAPKPGEEIE